MKEKKYDAYFTTAQNELILVPKVSTRPIIYGYVASVDKKEVEQFFKELGIDVYVINKFEWNAERGMPTQVS